MAKHAVPKKKRSKARTNRQFKAFQNNVRVLWTDKLQFQACGACGATTRVHHVCPECGAYRGKPRRKASATAAESKVTTVKAD